MDQGPPHKVRYSESYQRKKKVLSSRAQEALLNSTLISQAQRTTINKSAHVTEELLYRKGHHHLDKEADRRMGRNLYQLHIC